MFQFILILSTIFLIITLFSEKMYSTVANCERNGKYLTLKTLISPSRIAVTYAFVRVIAAALQISIP
jgi:hypothetical protein